MIEIKKLVPEVYYNRSRDFQIIGKTFEIVFNYLKLNTEMIGVNLLAENSDSSLLDLVSSTLGFKSYANYNQEQLKALCSIFSYALKNKGNINSIQSILNMLNKVEGISEKCVIEKSSDDENYLLIYIPAIIKDTKIFIDMLDYVLPAGMTFSLVKQQVIKNNTEETFISTTSDVNKDIQKTYLSGSIRYSVDTTKDLNTSTQLDELNGMSRIITGNDVKDL